MSFLLKPTIKTILKSSPNSHVIASGWIKKIRKHKRFWFAEINDGSTPESLQTVIPSDLIFKGSENENENEKDSLLLGSSLEIKGKLVQSIGGMQNIEILAEKIRILGACPGDSYPIQKLDNSPDFLRTNSLNFRLRTSHDSSIVRLKNELFHALSQTLKDYDFVRIFPPVLTEHDCEGGGEVFRVEANSRPNFFSKPTFLTVSTQLHLEIAAASFARVYSFSPVFRAENQHTSKHLSEFWMLECEISFIDELESLLNFIEKTLKVTVKSVQSNTSDSTLNPGKVDEILNKSFSQISYTDAIKELERSGQNHKFEFPVKWGKDLKTEHERFLAEVLFKGPVFVTDYPADLKPFYMKKNDDGITVSCCDLLVPGIGEIVGGGLREDSYDKLKSSLENKFKDTCTSLQWYLDLRRFGSVPHGGFGLGFDRFLQYISGTNNIRDIVMIPRYAGSIKF